MVLVEWSTAAAGDVVPKPVSFSSLREVPPARPQGYRFLQVGLDDGIDLVASPLAVQIGEYLWKHLDPGSKFGLPADFEQRLLVRTNDWIAVWSRRGIVLGAKSVARARADRLQQGFNEICSVVRQMHDLMVQMRSADPSPARTVERSEAILFELVGLQQKLAVPESAVLQRFFESSRLGEVLGMLRDLNRAAAERVETEAARELAEEQKRIAESMHENVGLLVSLQQKVEYVEIGIVFVYTAELLNIFRESLELDGFYTVVGILGFSVLAAILAAIGLKPWKQHEGKKHSGLTWRLAIRVAILIGGLVAFLRSPRGKSRPRTRRKGRKVAASVHRPPHASSVRRSAPPLPILFGQAERHRHAGAAGGRDDVHMGQRVGDELRLRGVFRIDARPAFGDRPIAKRHEGPKFSQHQLVDPRLVEGGDFVAVLVRVAEHHFAQTVLRCHHVNSVPIEVGRLFVDPPLKSGERFTDLEIAVVPQRETARQVRPDAQASG